MRGNVLGGVAAIAVVVAIVIGTVAGAWYLHRGPFAAPAETPAPAIRQEGIPSVADPDQLCTLAIGLTGPEFPTATQVTVPPGARVTVVARCAPGVQVVDLVVTAPPPAGAMLVLATIREGDAWIWRGETADVSRGQTLAFYGYADGRPTWEPVTLTVRGG